MREVGAGTSSRAARLERNLSLLGVFRALQMTMFPIAIVPLYWRDELGLAMSEIFLIQAMFGLFAAVFEFPGGFVADRIGYRVSMIIATACSFAGWITLGFAGDIWSILLGELLLAASLSLTSGTDAALLYESLLELDREPEFARWFGRTRSIGAVAEGSAALLAGLLFAIWSPLPFFLQAGVWCINAVIAWLLIEPLRHRPHVPEVWAKVRELFHFAAIRKPALRASMGVLLVLGLATFVPVWIVAIYAEKAGVPIVWIGPIWAAANYTVALGLWLSDRVGEELGLGRALHLCVALLALGFAGLGWSEALFGFVFYYAICLARGLNGPLLGHVQQRLIPSADRASLLSINSLLFRASFFLLGPVIGLGIDRMGEHAMLLISGAVAVPLGAVAVVWLGAVLGRED
jgi:MFS family permease